MRWTLRSGVYALSEVSMNDVRCAGSRRNIGLTRIRYILFCVLADIHYYFYTHSVGVARTTFTNVLLLYYQLLQQHGGTDSPALPTYIHLIFVLATTTTNINLQRASLPLKFVGVTYR